MHHWRFLKTFCAFRTTISFDVNTLLTLVPRSSQYMEKAPRGKHSTKGLGKMVPDGSEFRKLDDDVTVPAGKPVPSNVRATELMYNEYIVYDTSQVRSLTYAIQKHVRTRMGRSVSWLGQCRRLRAVVEKDPI